MKRLFFRVLAAVAALGFIPAAHAQSACRPADSASARMITWVSDIVTDPDPAAHMRAQLKLPKVAASQISYVTTSSVCNKVLTVYNANSGLTRAGVAVPPSGKIYVVKVGSVYVAKDPVKTFGEWAVYVTTDSKYKLLARSLGF